MGYQRMSMVECRTSARISSSSDCRFEAGVLREDTETEAVRNDAYTARSCGASGGNEKRVSRDRPLARKTVPIVLGKYWIMLTSSQGRQ